MLRISKSVEGAFIKASDDSFRQRALDYIRGVSAAERQSFLVPILDHTEAWALRYNMQAERSRLAMFVLAVRAGLTILERAEIAEILGQVDTPEHVRRRQLVNYLKVMA